MDKCKDKRFREMLYAYELGMLLEEERRELELHLLDCESCLQSVMEFKSAAQLLRHDADIRDSIEEIAHEHNLQPTRKSIWAKLIPSVAAVAILVILLILQPWEIQIRSKQAQAAYDILAVMYFENMVDENDSSRLGEIITDLLITDLSESQYVQVVSGQRLYDILKNMGREGQKSIDKDIATQVAKRADAKWMLHGKILQLEPKIILTSELVNMNSGLAMATQRINGFEDESLFSLVDKLAIKIRSDLSLPVEAQNEEDLPIEVITTNSVEAYRYYIEGLDYFMKYDWDKAEEKFLKAVEYDSTFAAAYLRLGMLRFSSGVQASKPWAEKAMRFIDKAPHRFQLAIRALDAVVSRKYYEGIAFMDQLVEKYPYYKEPYVWLGYFSRMLGNYNQAIEYINKAIELDSLFWNAYEMLGRVYNDMGDYEKAIWTVDKYISLAPNFAAAYLGKGNIYLSNDKIDQAIETFNKAGELVPDYIHTQLKLSRCYLYQREYAKSEQYFHEFTHNQEPNFRSTGLTYLALIPMYQGRFERTLEVLDSVISIDEQMYDETVFEGDLLWKYFARIRIYIETGLFDRAETEIEKTLKLIKEGEKAYLFLDELMCILAFHEIGKNEKAGQASSRMLGRLPENEFRIKLSQFTAGISQFSQGDYENAYENLKALDQRYDSFMTSYIFGICALETGRLEEAILALDDRPIIFGSMRFHWGIQAVKSYYYLGIAYERSNWPGKAIEMYEEFLDIWKNADPGIEEIEDARVRLQRLKNQRS